MFHDIIYNDMNPVEHLITPLAPYFLCNHYISTEIHPSSHKYIFYELNISANDLIAHKNYNDIKNFDIIQIQVDHFDFFYYEVLPILETNNILKILIQKATVKYKINP